MLEHSKKFHKQNTIN